MKKAFPWLRDKVGPQMNGGLLLKGEKVVIRERRLKDVSDDYAWRTDEELARLDATLPISMSYDDFLRHSREELVHGNPSSQRLAIDTLSGLHIGNCMYYDIDYQVSLAIMPPASTGSMGTRAETMITAPLPRSMYLFVTL